VESGSLTRIRLKGINKVQKRLAAGTIATYYYHRATGKRVIGDLGSPKFIQSYAEAEKSVQKRPSGTFNGLIRDYTLAIEFQQSLAPSTQKEYRRLLRSSEDEFGNLPTEALNDPRVRREFLDWREKPDSRATAKQTTD
jgi:hypothetical protein